MGLLLKSEIQNQSVKVEEKSGLVSFVHGELVLAFWVESMEGHTALLKPLASVQGPAVLTNKSLTRGKTNPNMAPRSLFSSDRIR